MNTSCVQAAPYEANLHTARRDLKKECSVCHQHIGQGELYYSVRYRIGVDAHPHAVHAQELTQFAVKGREGWEYPFKEDKLNV